jgi:cytochrome c oxidase subunit 4
MSEHIVSRKVYVGIFAALMVLTAITIFVSGINLGPFNTIVALAIAVSKAILVVLYFMHVRYSSKLTQVVVAGGVFWLVIMIVLVMADYLSRPH